MSAQGEIVNAPIPEECHAERSADYGGIGVSWGLNYKKESAAACCQACKDHANQNPSSQPCNVWVWCGEAALPTPALVACLWLTPALTVLNFTSQVNQASAGLLTSTTTRQVATPCRCPLTAVPRILSISVLPQHDHHLCKPCPHASVRRKGFPVQEPAG